VLIQESTAFGIPNAGGFNFHEGFNVHAVVVFVDQLFELLHQIGASLVEIHHVQQLVASDLLQFFRLSPFSAFVELGLHPQILMILSSDLDQPAPGLIKQSKVLDKIDQSFLFANASNQSLQRDQSFLTFR